MRIEDTTTIARNPAVIGTSLGEEVVLLAEDGQYLELNPVGVSVWEELETPRTLGALVLVLATAYGADAAQVRADVGPFVADLHARGLVTLS